MRNICLECTVESWEFKGFQMRLFLYICEILETENTSLHLHLDSFFAKWIWPQRTYSVFLPLLGEVASHSYAACAVTTADATFVIMQLGAYYSIAASAHTLPFHTNWAAVGPTLRPIYHLRKSFNHYQILNSSFCHWHYLITYNYILQKKSLMSILCSVYLALF